jgi:ATP-binding protein involved in chromosome partitioning
MCAQQEGRVIKKINIDMKCDRICAECEKYFDCNLPDKEHHLSHGRMQKVQENLAGVKHKVMVMGGKGGVGKTMLTVNFAAALAKMGRKVSILDQVFDCPCVPKMLGMEKERMKLGENGLIPGVGPYEMQVVSMGLILLEDESITWFHDMKRNAMEEFLTTVSYGVRDYLVIDVPAGTSADTVYPLQYIPDLEGALVVTIPSDVSQGVAYRAIQLCKKAGKKVFGVIENMSDFTCTKCHRKVEILQSGGGEALARNTGVPFLGKIPMDYRVADSNDRGVPFVMEHPDFEGTKTIERCAESIDAALGV